ncbi:MAG: flagellar M-ring protein FliF [Candidatus Aminicenantes bacterium]|nr:flagellar M-ring protein FliF [Candidatus Aminicenantes bacterium]NIM84379.1 flagellar M-ring protein FliF [Candidatus Aminicenantes bacterium]NIN23866.1 flagellar M-ring protein FliF [Candidatus Aminicenantes bacterium]NIN47582.1 flagellar M-ring protein FliF [Candidatus Aminicenantes bacterium]NIN90502.1 flagellar M-ring protein FliF [Candidatus Aminicenantes bacterium]
MAGETSAKGDVLTRVKNYLSRFSLSQKIFMGAVILLAIVGIILIISIATALNYGVLFSNLSVKDAGLIIEQLKAKKIPYELSAGGSVVRVPESRIAELRIQLAAVGLPEGGGSLSTTDLVHNINYIRAVERELGRTLSQLRGVNWAKVHITMPIGSTSGDEKEDAKASVVLNLRPGARVTGALIPAILHLIAQSVDGLRPENIVIVDSHGKLLSAPKAGREGIFTGMSASQLAYREKLESSLSREIISVLEPHVGSGKVRASVKLKLNFDKEESTEETVDPNTVTKVSEKSETTSSTGAPGAAGGEAAAAKSKSEKTSVNYEVSKKVTRLTRPVGDILRLSVAVLVDDAENVRVREGQLIREPRSRTPEELEAIKKIVQAAVGFNSQRGDVIEVANLPFDTSSETISEYYLQKQKSQDLTNMIIKYAAIGVGLFLLYLLIIRPVYRRFKEIMKQTRMPKAAEIEIPQVDSEKMAALQEARDKAEIERELLEKYKIPRSTRKMSVIREKVKRFAEKNVDETAALVKSFLIED